MNIVISTTKDPVLCAEAAVAAMRKNIEGRARLLLVSHFANQDDKDTKIIVIANGDDYHVTDSPVPYKCTESYAWDFEHKGNRYRLVRDTTDHETKEQ